MDFSVMRRNEVNMSETKIDYAGQLDEQKLKAVKTTEGYVRVIAGAGSGKTRALTYRYAYIVDELGESTANIACVTFTNKAADEMKERIQAMLGDQDLGYICTFHSLGYQILKEEFHRLHWPLKETHPLEDEEKEAVLQRIYKGLGLTRKDITLDKARKYITEQKVQLEYAELLKAPKDAETEAKISEMIESAEDPAEKIFYSYLADQRKHYTIDYDDMVCIPLYLFHNNPDMVETWANRFEYFMVDEFQDVSKQNYELCEILTSKHKNLFVVGDPDQLIYSFRGAQMEFFMDFADNHPGTTDIELCTNYRSKEGIVNAANKLISVNKDRIDKQMNVLPENKDGAKVKYMHLRTRAEEAKTVAQTIKQLIADGVEGDKIAVLYRAHSVARRFEQALRDEKIHYKTHGTEAFYQRKEIRSVLAYMRLINDDNDEEFCIAVQNPKRGIGEGIIERLKAHATENHCSLYVALEHFVDQGRFDDADVKENAEKFVALIRDTRENFKDMTVSNVMNKLYTESGLEELYRTLGDNDRLENIAALKEGVREAEDRSADVLTFDKYMTAVGTYIDEDKDNKEAPVKLMTVHAAKGLEMPYVFVVGMNERIFPSSNARTTDAMEEERRLAYVAFTRAEDTLYITESEKELKSDKSSFTYPSRFIFNTGFELLDQVCPLSEDLERRARLYIARSEKALQNKDEYEARKGLANDKTDFIRRRL